MTFSNPITGGQGALVRPAIKSPNYVTGISGWTINKDGSAEFNNLTIRGTFNGPDYIINNKGEFFYSGTPAAGNLIASIAATAGTDGFGNKYLAGVSTYDNSLNRFTQANSGLQEYGLIVAGTPDQADSGKVSANSQSLDIIGITGTTVPTANAAAMSLFPGAVTSVPTGTEPAVGITGFNGGVCASVHLSGAAVKTNLSQVPYTWQTPGYNANWAGSTTFNTTANWGPLQYRLDAEDNVWLVGCFTSAAGAGAAVLNLPVPYRPAAQWPLWVQRNNGGVFTGFNAEVGPSGNFNILVGSGGGMAAGNEFLVNAKYPLGNLP